MKGQRVHVLAWVGLFTVMMAPGFANAADDDDRLQRAAALHEKIKATNSRHGRPVFEHRGAPLHSKTVIGADAIKAKMEASKAAGKRGNAKLQSYLNGFVGGLQHLSDTLSGRDGSQPSSGKMQERKMSFQQRLRLEKERIKRRRSHGG